MAFERTCSYQFSLWETFKKKQIIHTGILDFSFLAVQFPQSVPATANGSQTWFFSNTDERQEKWVNVFKTAYFFGQGPSCRPATHTKKNNPQWQVPKCMRYRRYRRQRAAVSRSTICLLGVGFSLCRVVFALGQAKFCVFASTIRIAGCFLLCVQAQARICETSSWLCGFWTHLFLSIFLAANG